MSRISILIYFISLSTLSASVLCPSDSWAQTERTLSLSKAELKKLTDAAESKARELGYEPESLEREVAKSGNLFRVTYYPKQRSGGVIIYGGAVNIYLNKSGQIIHIEKVI
jgi:hypothetical protein